MSEWMDRVDGHFYSRNDEPCSYREYALARRGNPYVGSTTLRHARRQHVWVSTVWLGTNCAVPLSDPPLIYATVVFVARWGDLNCELWPSRAAAEAGHEEMVTRVTRNLIRAGRTVVRCEGSPWQSR